MITLPFTPPISSSGNIKANTNAKIVIELDENDTTAEKRKAIWDAAWKQVDSQVVAKVNEFKEG